MRKELLKGLSEEQIKKVEACKSPEEILNLAKAEGIELTDEQLEAVSGGGYLGTLKCKKCGSKNIHERSQYYPGGYGSPGRTVYFYTCRECDYEWKLKKFL